MFHNCVFKYILNNIAESWIMRPYFYILTFFSLFIPLLCHNYKGDNSNMSGICLWSVLHCPWGPWNSPWGGHPVEILHLADVDSWRMVWQAKSPVFYYPCGTTAHSGIIKIHLDLYDYSIHFCRIPFSFHP